MSCKHRVNGRGECFSCLKELLDDANGWIREELEGYPDCARRDALEAFLSRSEQPAVVWERTNVPDDLPTNDATAELMDRAESAESQLAAVREAANNQALTPHQRWERIMLVLTQPTPGAGTGEDQ
jgi:hypothetical protein